MSTKKNLNDFMNMTKEQLVDWTVENIEVEDLLSCLSTDPVNQRKKSSSSRSRSDDGVYEAKESVPPSRVPSKTKSKSPPKAEPKTKSKSKTKVEPKKKPPPPKGPKPKKNPPPPKGPKPKDIPARRKSTPTQWKDMMKKAGASLSNNNDAASNRCSTTKKLTVIGRSQPKGTRKPPKFIVISYIKKKWELL